VFTIICCKIVARDNLSESLFCLLSEQCRSLYYKPGKAEGRERRFHARENENLNMHSKLAAVEKWRDKPTLSVHFVGLCVVCAVVCAMGSSSEDIGLASEEVFQRELKYGAHNYHPLPVALSRAEGRSTLLQPSQLTTELFSASCIERPS